MMMPTFTFRPFSKLFLLWRRDPELAMRLDAIRRVARGLPVGAP